ARVDRAWVERYLLEPTDLRPHLVPSMPRLALGPGDARDLAAYLVPAPDRGMAPAPSEEAAIAQADLGEGRRLLETKGCGACHAFTGVAPLPAFPPAMGRSELALGRTLAPDLRVV